MKKPEMKTNRTGMSTAPGEAKKMEENARIGAAAEPQRAQEIARIRAMVAEEAPLCGIMPQTAEGKGQNFFLNKLGQRLAFERTGVRLYDALIVQVETKGTPEMKEKITRLREFREQEVRHFGTVKKAIRDLGGDPTLVTPAAAAAGVEAGGLLQVATDPRTEPAHAVHALLVAEMTDQDSWKQLVRMAEQLGRRELVEEFGRALREEEDHLTTIRGMIETHVMKELA